MSGYAIEIDGAKLRREIKKRNLKMSIASLEIGYSSSYLNWVARTGRITRPAITSLDMKYNIKLADIAKEQPEPETPEAVQEAPEKDARVVVEINYDELQTAVYHAVYGAVKKALAEFAEAR